MVDSNTLVIITSISGNTAESLAILDSAHEKNRKIMYFSADGKMEEYCTKNKIEHRVFPQMHFPRSSFPIFLYDILKTLVYYSHEKS
ncbi:MAG: hypothetical protein AUG16_00850 [Thaumarchaeota archaeon 13_1_20CM_2_39_20]|nr:MAG: hypothetical protein AUI92_04850 [Thaumarchaeota archaeon 13_1_40CM_3_38_6]OLD22816.1 MAG: hypothetical protein AUI59_01015 [Thaumarchaeota archaeon 13_1_40CM_2_39_13_1]OLE41220.1 MAG: hypothetical protein AUG16_00850 [Thaumarchaeota archaeon 13_1_20CM_2_39_20]